MAVVTDMGMEDINLDYKFGKVALLRPFFISTIVFIVCYVSNNIFLL